MSLPSSLISLLLRWHGSILTRRLAGHQLPQYDVPLKRLTHSGPPLIPKTRVREDTAHDVRASSTTTDSSDSIQALRIPGLSQTLKEDDLSRMSGFWQHSDQPLSSTGPDQPNDPQEWIRQDHQQEPTHSRSTPSARLFAALEKAGYSGLISKTQTNKTDLSFFNVRKFDALDRSTRPIQHANDTFFNLHKFGALPRATQSIENMEGTEVRHSAPLPDLVTGYITHVLPLLSEPQARSTMQSHREYEAIARIFSSDSLTLLQERKYCPEDVVIWSWIVTSTSTDAAARRILAVSARLSRSGRTPLPLFVFLLVLRSRTMSAASLKVIMDCMWVQSASTTQDGNPMLVDGVVDASSAVILIVRLMRHARAVWPEALSEITSLATRIIRFTNTDPTPEKAQTVCHTYNRLLTLLSLPTSAHPFRTITIQQQAQFKVLRTMMEMSPRLLITREGFRALTKVQLAHAKTKQERRWARLKALSWPPWKEEKSGLDADTDPAGSLSRATEVLAYMQESGYAPLDWEKQARIYAGWDTDRSPAIQRRKLLSKGPLVSSAWAFEAALSLDPARELDIWAARISATRTVKEAWACFCSFEATGHLHGLAPWHAMFERLLNTVNEFPAEYLTPGDGRETYPEPTSPRDFLYVPTEPPTVDQLFNMMLAKNIQPAGRLLADLLDHATSIVQGWKYMEHSRLSEMPLDVLRRAEKYSEDYIRVTLSRLPDYLFAAFVRLLTRSSRSVDIAFHRPTSASSLEPIRALSLGQLPRSRGVNPFQYAERLVIISRTRHLPTWTALFTGLRHQFRRDPTAMQYRATASRAWKHIYSLLGMMKEVSVAVDFGCFNEICPIIEKTLLYRVHINNKTMEGPSNAVVTRLVRRIFRDIVVGQQRSTIRSNWLPNGPDATILSVPSPTNLLMMVRALGVSGQVDDLVDLLRWMNRFAAELEAVSKQLSNGPRAMRRVLVIIRVFLERSWVPPEAYTGPAVSQSLLKEAIELVERHGEWGGWPTDEEVQDSVMGDQTGQWFNRILHMERQIQVEIATRESLGNQPPEEGKGMKMDHSDAEENKYNKQGEKIVDV